MGQQMEVEVFRSVEFRDAEVTRHFFHFALVGAPVGFQSLEVHETLVAKIALVLPFAGQARVAPVPSRSLLG